MLGLCLVEASPHRRGMPLASFSVSSGFAAGQTDACCLWFTGEVSEGLERNGAESGRTAQLAGMRAL